MSGPVPNPSTKPVGSKEQTPASAQKESQAESQAEVQRLQESLGEGMLEALARAASCFPGPLCDRCLGRLLGRSEPRGAPLAKGGMVRAHLALAAPDVPMDCGWCEGFFTQTDHFARRAIETLQGYEFNSFLVATRMHPDVLALEKQAQRILEEAGVDGFEPLKMEFNREVGAQVHETLGVPVDLGRPDAIAQVDPYFDEVLVTTSNLYLYARYRKLDRTIPQTRWPCRSCKGKGCMRCDQTGQQYLDSVESLVSEVPLGAFEARESSFHGAGREDIDALMLGTGRPFVLELKLPRLRRPRRADSDQVIDLEELQNAINDHAGGRVEVLGLRWSEKAEVARVKTDTPDKAYRAHIVAERPVSRARLDDAVHQIAGTEIDQRTPARVAHRRADKVRTRRVHAVELVGFARHVESDDPAPSQPDPKATQAVRFSLDIRAASGTYIKELVSGDDGRTQPSFAGLLDVPMRVEALDVVAVEDERP